MFFIAYVKKKITKRIPAFKKSHQTLTTIKSYTFLFEDKVLAAGRNILCFCGCLLLLEKFHFSKE